MDRINDGPTFGHPRITRRAVELFERWHTLYDKDDESDDRVAAAKELMRELHQPPWEYSAKAAGIAYTPSADIAASLEYDGH